jgi:hypothetical protein
MIKHTISYLIANVLSFIKPATIKNSILIISQTIEKLYRTLILLNEKAINSQVSMCFFQNFPKYKRITSIRTLYKLGPLHPPMESYHISLEHNTENESPHQIKFAPLRETHCFWQGWPPHRSGREWSHSHPLFWHRVAARPPHCYGRRVVVATPQIWKGGPHNHPLFCKWADTIWCGRVLLVLCSKLTWQFSVGGCKGPYLHYVLVEVILYI